MMWVAAFRSFATPSACKTAFFPGGASCLKRINPRTDFRPGIFFSTFVKLPHPIRKRPGQDFSVSLFDKQLVCVTGLPRAGSTLMCQLLAHHPAIHCPGQSSPLPQFLAALRQHTADNEFLLAQLDRDPDGVHGRLMESYRGFMAGWFSDAEAGKRLVVDKNRAWMGQFDFAERLAPGCRMIVCLREPGQIFGSVEARHQASIGMDFPDHLANASAYDRANRLFARDGVIGLALNGFRGIQDLPDSAHRQILCVLFERLVQHPERMMKQVWEFLGVDPVDIDFDNLSTLPGESDSHYRFKYTHRTHSRIRPPGRHQIPARIEAEIRHSFEWFYKIFYPA